MQYMRVQISGDAIVVAFDMCSSSNIIEELTLSGNLKRLNEFLTALKRYLASARRTLCLIHTSLRETAGSCSFPRRLMARSCSSFCKTYALSSEGSSASKC